MNTQHFVHMLTHSQLSYSILHYIVLPITFSLFFVEWSSLYNYEDNAVLYVFSVTLVVLFSASSASILAQLTLLLASAYCLVDY